MKIRWGKLVAIGVVVVIGLGAVLAVTKGGGGDSASTHGDAVAPGRASLEDAPTASSVVDESNGVMTDRAADATGLGGLATPELRAQVVKRATIELEVGKRRSESTVSDVIRAVGLVGGFVESTDQSDGRSNLTVRVPAAQFDETLERLKAMGRERRLEVHGEDVTGAVTDLEARLRNLRAQEAVLLDLMRKATTIADSITVQQQLSQNQEQIEQLDGQRRALADQTTFATLAVSITPKGAPAAGTGSDSSYTLGAAWDDALDAMLAVTGGTLVVLGALLPFLVMGGAGLLVWRAVQRRQRRSHPAAPAAG